MLVTVEVLVVSVGDNVVDVTVGGFGSFSWSSSVVEVMTVSCGSFSHFHCCCFSN